jgi:hypothetical protein
MSDSIGRAPSWLPWTVVLTAALLLVGSAAYVGSSLGQSVLGPGMAEVVPSVFPSSYELPSAAPLRPARASTPAGNAGGAMRTRVWLAGNGAAVTTIAAARNRATAASAPNGLHPAEVVQFSSGFYVELKDAAGHPAAEVLVDPMSGAVFTEYGPAMMWTSGSTPYLLSSEQAIAIANAWLQTNAPGQSVDAANLFPGHYTMDTVSAGGTVGMLSVNAATGAVWYHTWHGTFIAKEKA